MERRTFIKGSAAALAASSGATGIAKGLDAVASSKPTGQRFHLNYAPHFGMFRHHAGEDIYDQLRFMADEGFTAFEDNWMVNRSPEEQEKIGQLLGDLGMQMGVFVAHAEFGQVTFASDDRAVRTRIQEEMERSVATAQRVGATWCTVVPGAYDKGIEWDYQTANVIDNLRFAAEICEPSGLVMVLESLNPWRDHAGCFLTKVPQAYLICRGVDSPSCKILDDLYHQQISEGNLIPNIDRAWDEIGYFQIGDNPGRNEPGTGEIHYLNVFRHIHQKGFEGILGMEHGNSIGGKEGERAVIDAYVAADAFTVD